jgi:hypothetical protein
VGGRIERRQGAFDEVAVLGLAHPGPTEGVERRAPQRAQDAMRPPAERSRRIFRVRPMTLRTGGMEHHRVAGIGSELPAPAVGWSLMISFMDGSSP